MVTVFRNLSNISESSASEFIRYENEKSGQNSRFLHTKTFRQVNQNQLPTADLQFRSKVASEMIGFCSTNRPVHDYPGPIRAKELCPKLDVP